MKYTDIHLFDKAGHEIPITLEPSATLSIANTSKRACDALFYLYKTDPDNTQITAIKKSSGSRFPFTSIGSVTTAGLLTIDGKERRINIDASVGSMPSVDGYSYYIDSISPVIDSSTCNDIPFPSIKMKGSVSFEKTSTGLVETQSLYVLANVSGIYKKLSEIVDTETIAWKNKYKLLFFIDCRNQKDFRFFTIKNDEVIWSNKCIIDFNSEDSESTYRVNIGFQANEEGLYEETMYVCLLEGNAETGNLYEIGEFTLSAEAVGEDERYRTLFKNFGIPDPVEYQNVFANTDQQEANTDNMLLNENSKKMFLSYSSIFPYIGTYKALVNAVKTLGYTDIFFKEWYKKVGDQISNSYITYDISYNANPTANTINSAPIEERLSLKKLNWLSMIYEINKEIAGTCDKYGFPNTKDVYGYNNPDILVKLISLKQWLEKNIIGLNCRIVDIGGEGVYFERYRLTSYGTYQEHIEWNNEKNIAPYIDETDSDGILEGGVASIEVHISNPAETLTFEDIKNVRFCDYCTGYIDTSDTDCKYHTFSSNDASIYDVSTYIYVGSTIENMNELQNYKMKAYSSVSTFSLGCNFIDCVPDNTSDDEYVDCLIDPIIIDNDEIMFNPAFLLKNEPTCAFTKLPKIEIKRADIKVKEGKEGRSTIYTLYPSDSEGTRSYRIKDIHGNMQTVHDPFIFVPPTYTIDKINECASITPQIGENKDSSVNVEFGKKVKSSIEKMTSENVNTFGLRLVADNITDTPMFKIIGYQIADIKNNIPYNNEFYIDIIDGQLIFEDPENNRILYIDIEPDDNQKRTVKVNTVYYTEPFNLTEYIGTEDSSTFKKFVEGRSYTDFTETYTQSPDNAININLSHRVDVHNAGEFNVDVFGRDIYNNAFGANCDNTIKIDTKTYTIDSYGYSENANGISTETLLMHPEYEEFPIFKPLKRITDISTNRDDLCISYNPKDVSYNDLDNSYVHVMDITDRYRIVSIEKETGSTNSNLCDMFGATLDRDVDKHFARVLEAHDNTSISVMCERKETEEGVPEGSTQDYFNKIDKSSYNYADVNVILYNELANFPVYQTYGTMFNEDSVTKNSPTDASINKSTGYYKLNINENISADYVWADMVRITENRIHGYLQKTLSSIIQDKVHSDILSTNTTEKIINELCVNAINNIKENGISITPFNLTYVLDEIRKNSSLNPYNGFVIDSSTDTSNILEYIFRKDLRDINFLRFMDYLEVINKIGNTIDSSIAQEDEIIIDSVVDANDANLKTRLFGTQDSSVADDQSTAIRENLPRNIINYIVRYGIEDIMEELYNVITSCDSLQEVSNWYSFQIYDTENESGLLNAIYDNYLNIDLLEKMRMEYHLFNYDIMSEDTDFDKNMAIESVKNAIHELSETPECDMFPINQETDKYTFSENVKNGLITKVVETFSYYTNEKTTNGMYLTIPADNSTANMTAVSTTILSALYDIKFDEMDTSTAVSTSPAEYYKNAMKNNIVDIIKKLCDKFNRNNAEDSNANIWGGILFCMYTSITFNAFFDFLIRINTDPSSDSFSYNPCSSYIYDSNRKLRMDAMTIAASHLYTLKEAFTTKLDTNLIMDQNYALYLSNGYDDFDHECELTVLKSGETFNDVQNVSIYDKIRNGMCCMIFSAMRGEENKISWLTKGTLKLKESNNWKVEYNKALFALLGYGSNKYIKKFNNIDINLSSPGDVLDKDEYLSLNTLMNPRISPYISIYIKPSWNVKIYAFLLQDDDKTSDDEFILDDGTTIPRRNYILIDYNTFSLNPDFKRGEKVKLIFETVDTSKYIGQSTYEYIGRQADTGYMILEGEMNPRYFDDESEYLWCAFSYVSMVLESDAEGQDIIPHNHQYDSSTSDSSTYVPVRKYYTTNELLEELESRQNVIRYYLDENKKYGEMTIKIGQTENLLTIPLRYTLEDDHSKSHWDFRVYSYNMQDGTANPIKVVAQKTEKINMYISYAHHSYVDYVSTINNSSIDNDNNQLITLNDTITNRKIIDFVDDTFSLSIREFNVNDGLKAWCDQETNLVGNGENSILVPRNKSYALFKVNDPDKEIRGYRWKVIDSDTRKIKYEVYNPVLYIREHNKGAYDIEMCVFDKDGNAFTRTYKRAYEIV